MSDWSSVVCSSDLLVPFIRGRWRPFGAECLCLDRGRGRYLSGAVAGRYSDLGRARPIPRRSSLGEECVYPRCRRPCYRIVFSACSLVECYLPGPYLPLLLVPLLSYRLLLVSFLLLSVPFCFALCFFSLSYVSLL